MREISTLSMPQRVAAGAAAAVSAFPALARSDEVFSFTD
jgi:hypothetical protein